MTANAFGLRRSDHRDMLLVLDEAEGAGANERDRQNLARSVIFTGSTTTEKLRMTDKRRTHAPLRLALLSTANTSLREVLRNEPAARLEAAMSRVLPILVDSEGRDGLPLFDYTPAGFDDPGEAASVLREAVDVAYGKAGPLFAEFIAEKVSTDEQAFKRELRARMSATLARVKRGATGLDVRRCRTLAAVEVAGLYAREARVLPEKWGDPSAVTDRLTNKLINAPAKHALVDSMEVHFISYIQQQLSSRKFMPASALLIPDLSVRRMVPGFVTNNDESQRELLVDPKYFMATFQDAHSFLKRASRSGRLRTHVNGGVKTGHGAEQKSATVAPA